LHHKSKQYKTTLVHLYSWRAFQQNQEHNGECHGMGDHNVTNKQNKETNFLIDTCLCQSEFLHKIATDDFREALCSFKMAAQAFYFCFCSLYGLLWLQRLNPNHQDSRLSGSQIMRRRGPSWDSNSKPAGFTAHKATLLSHWCKMVILKIEICNLVYFSTKNLIIW